MVNYVIERKNKIINVLKGFFFFLMNGRKIETLVPSFSSDKMVIIPSDFFIICLVIYSPSPKPCCSVLSRLNCTVPSINFSSSF
jgi:hypothetical protein